MIQSNNFPAVMAHEFAYASDELDAMAAAQNYYGGILEHFCPYLGSSLIEVGAGVGTFATHILAKAPNARLTLVEPARNNFPHLQQRFAGDRRVSLAHCYLEEMDVPEPVDSVVAVNVLEHVRDDDGFLTAAYQRIRTGGHILLYVPALPMLFGTLDEAFEHYRRYTKTSLRTAMHRAGFDLVNLRYTNFPGIATWFVAGKLLRRRTLSSRQVGTYDRLVVPAVTRFERLVEPPFGQSLIVVGLKH